MNNNDKTDNAENALHKIIGAEKEAAALIAKAKDETGPSLIQIAQEESLKIKKQILERTRTEAEARKRLIVEEARREADRIKDEGESEMRRIRNQAQPFIESAVGETERRLAERLKGISG